MYSSPMLTPEVDFAYITKTLYMLYTAAALSELPVEGLWRLILPEAVGPQLHTLPATMRYCE